MKDPDIIIKQLSPDITGDFLDFFDNRAFADNPGWQACYCVFFHHQQDETDWLARTKQQNRQEAISLIKSGRMNGFLAYYNNSPAGWCNVNSKTVYAFNKTRVEVLTCDDDNIISLVCFLVDHRYRRRGISSGLLQKIIMHYTGSGKLYLEAYPAKKTTRDADNYYGPLDMYLKNGFHIDKEFKDYYIVRRKL